LLSKLARQLPAHMVDEGYALAESTSLEEVMSELLLSRPEGGQQAVPVLSA
jgi:hypothetical protein